MSYRVGYARISSIDECLVAQIESLGQCDKVFFEFAPDDNARRPALDRCLDYLRCGDTFVFEHLDRVSSSACYCAELGERFKEKNIIVESLGVTLDLSSATDCLLFNTMGVFCEHQALIKKSREAARADFAQMARVRMGREVDLSEDRLVEIVNRGMVGEKTSSIIRDHGITKSDFLKLMGSNPIGNI